MDCSKDSLFIKQAAILEVIEDQKLINFASLRRRFLGINERTLRYHLKKLAEKRVNELPRSKLAGN